MTDKEIKDLAKQCSLYYQGHTGNKAYNLTNRLTIESYALMILKWLSDRYEIVSKEKVRELYKESNIAITPDTLQVDIWTGEARKILLESLFSTLKSEEK